VTRQPKQLPIGVRLAYGSGSAAEGVKTAAFSTFVLYYYNQVLEVSGTLTGIALFLALLVDAVTDPLAGSLSDGLRSRWGRRHPFMAASALPIAVMLWALFNPPAALGEIGLFLWLTATAIGVRIGLTLFHVPHLALGAELADDYDGRTRLFAVASLFGAAGGYGTAWVAYAVFFPTTEGFAHGLLDPQAYAGFSLAAALAICGFVAVCVLGTAGQIPHLSPPAEVVRRPSLSSLVHELSTVFANPSYRSIFFGLLLGTVVVGVEGAFQTYMGVHFWGLSAEQLQYPVLGVILGLPFAVALAPILTRRFDKRGALIGSAAITIVVINTPILLRLAGVLPPNGDPLVLRLVVTQAFLAGMFGPVILVTINSMFADIADEQELVLGRRQEGVIYAARAFSLKAAGAMGAFLGGVGLDLVAFPRGAAPGTVEPDVVFRLGLIYGPVTSTFTFLGLLLYMGYRLDRHRIAEIHAELDARRPTMYALDLDPAVLDERTGSS
jgi:Na+/melibiose symporter-like transporter